MPETPERRQVSDAQMRDILNEYLALMAALNDKRGTRLNADFVAKALGAIREDRIVIIPKEPPATILVEHDDWSDLFKVPLEALGLVVGLHRLLSRAGVTTVGLLTSHSLSGIARSFQTANSGRKLSGRYKEELEQKLAARNLEFATDNSGIPLEYFSRHPFLNIFQWWSAEDEAAFCKAHGLVTLGDLSELTVERIQSKPLPDYSAVGDTHPLDPADPESLKLVVKEFNFLLRSYGLSEIALPS